MIDNYIEQPLLLVDTAGTNMGEGGEVSKFNTGEAGIVCCIV
jgi:hypothetical protein